MRVDWTVACGAEDPVLVVPWADAASGLQFVDLRSDPYDVALIDEAERQPVLAQVLRALNSARSPVFTAKCDVWPMELEELTQLLQDADADMHEYGEGYGDAADLTGFASYIDLVWRERAIFTSLHQHEQILHRMRRHAEPLVHPQAAVECVLRPAMVDLNGPQEGFAVTLYVRAFGIDAATAEEQWALALREISGLIRVKDLALV